ncbi:MAG: aminoacetone oxidase family FAD-binding enzyme, partial [Phycisphaerae bacterium]
RVRVTGPALWTHFGLSGPAALNISRFWNRATLESREPQLRLSFLPSEDFESIERRILEEVSNHPRTSLAGLVRKWLPTRVADAVLAHLSLQPRLALGQVTKAQRRALCHGLVEFPLDVRGTRGYGFAEVTAGGISLKEVNPKTMESRKTPGLYLVGEVLDVDARIGGFNFQWAWSSGFVAGRAIASSLETTNQGTADNA